MKKIKNILLGIFLVISSVFMLKVDATVLEDPNSYTGDVYIMGSTKFDNNYIITGERAYEAGINEVLLYHEMNLDSLEIDKTTYYFSSLTKKWYAIPSDGGSVKTLTAAQEKKFENDIQIVFTNNKVKMVDFEYAGTVDVESLPENISYSNGKFSIPANIWGFSFSNGIDTIDVTISRNSNYEGEPGSFYIPNYVEIYNGSNSMAWITTNNENKIFEDQLYHYGYGENLAVDYFEDEDGNKIDFSTRTFEDGEKIYAITAPAVAYFKGRDYSINTWLDALKVSSEEHQVHLLNNLVVSSLIKLDTENSNHMYLNLNGFTLSRDNGSFVIYITGKNNNLTISNGTIESTAGQVITVGDGVVEDQNINLTINSDVTINAGGISGIAVIGNGAQLDFYGTINMTANDTTGITGRGNAADAGSVINVHSGAVISSEFAGTIGLYLPHEGVTTIEDASITASTAIGIKAGKLNIIGGVFNANGTNVDPQLYGNGIYSTGDTIYVEMNPSYLDNIKINIDGAYLNSENANQILVYNPTGMEAPEINVSDDIVVEMIPAN